MSNTVTKAKSLGVFPKPAVFTVDLQDETQLCLSYDLGDIDISEVFVRHSKDKVILDVVPGCKGFLIEDPHYLAAACYPDESPRIDAFLERYADARWDSCSPEQLFQFFADYFTDARYIEESSLQHLLGMIKPLVMELCRRRDVQGIELNHVVLRDHLPPKKYCELWVNSDLEHPSESHAELQKYLSQFSKVHADGAEDWSPSSYKSHAYGTMLASEVMSGYADRGAHRPYRLSHCEVTHPVDKPIEEFATYTFGGRLFIKLKFSA